MSCSFVHPKRAHAAGLPYFMRLHLIIKGRVQGVFFRSETRELANKHNVSGWIRNNTDGSVEAVFEGSEESLKELLMWCEEGPSGARVEHIEINWEREKGIIGFEVR